MKASAPSNCVDFGVSLTWGLNSLHGHHNLNACNCLPAILNVLHPLRLRRLRRIYIYVCNFARINKLCVNREQPRRAWRQSLCETLTGVKKSLTGPTWFEMSGNRIKQDLAEEWRASRPSLNPSPPESRVWAPRRWDCKRAGT